MPKTAPKAPQTAFQKRSGARRKFSPKVAKDRAGERGRRSAEARRRAWVVLADRHRKEYRELFEAELSALNEERGPLPGDES